MFQEPDAFSSQHVEETVDQLSVNDPSLTSASEQARLKPDARLVHDMQMLYAFERRRYQRALQRVEDRLVEQYVTKGERPAPQPVQSGRQARASRPIQQGRMYSMEQKKSRMSSFGRRISVLVAVLVMAVLVGSLVLVMNAAHQKTAHSPGNTTITGSGSSVTPGVSPTPTATPDPIQQGKIVYTSPASFDDFYTFAWSPNNQRVASSTQSKVQIWDATTGKNEKTFTPSSGGGSVLALAWSHDGKSLAVGSGQLQIIDPTTGVVKQTFPSAQAFAGGSSGSALSAMNPFSGGNMIYATSWSPDGTLMATSLYGNTYGNVVEVWNVGTGRVIYTFRGQASDGVESVSWSADGKYVASAGYDGTVQVWNAHTGQVIFNHKASGGLPYAAWAPTGKTLAFISGANTIQVWDVAANKMVASHSDITNNDLAWSHDGKQIASGSGRNVVIWDAATGSTISTFSGQGNHVRSLAWSPNGQYIVSGSGGEETGNNYAKVWQV